jgi:hypothetical protein
MTNEPMTIEDLAALIKTDVVDKMATKDDIARLEQRFDGVDHRLDGVDHRCDSMESRMGRIETRLDNVDTSVADLRTTNRDLIDVLKGKKLLTDEDATLLHGRRLGRQTL